MELHREGSTKPPCPSAKVQSNEEEGCRRNGCRLQAWRWSWGVTHVLWETVKATHATEFPVAHLCCAGSSCVSPRSTRETEPAGDPVRGCLSVPAHRGCKGASVGCPEGGLELQLCTEAAVHSGGFIFMAASAVPLRPSHFLDWAPTPVSRTISLAQNQLIIDFRRIFKVPHNNTPRSV